MTEKIFLYNALPCENNTFFLHQIFKFFEKNNYPIVSTAETSDTIIISTCIVTQEVEDKCKSLIAALQKKFGTNKRFIIYGCLATLKRATDGKNGMIFIPPHDLDVFNGLFQHTIPIEQINENVYSRAFSNEPRDIYRVLIAQGCVHNCSYCAIKSAKGRLKSKKPARIMSEIKKGAKLGYRHFKLVADDCGCYGMDLGTGLGVLLDRICGLGIAMRLDIHYIEPGSFLRYFRQIERAVAKGLLKDMNVPIQTTSRRILKLMNRRYEIEKVMEAVSCLKKNHPVFISTDIIAGFPSETRDDFHDTLSKTQIFDKTGIFLFSPRTHTPASKFNRQLSRSEMDYRAKIASELEEKDPKRYQFSVKYDENLAGKNPTAR